MEGTPISAMSGVRTVSGSSIEVIPLPSQVISTKLDDSNYLLWKEQIFATICGFGLEGFLTGESLMPEKFLTGTSNDGVGVNPDYIAWNRQDRLITSWLLSSMTQSTIIGVVGLSNSKEIWETIESNFAGQSRAKLMQLKYQLQTLKKGSMSMREYLNKVKSCCDVLASAGERISDDNHILHILSGLGPEYNPVMVSLTSRAEPCTLREAKAYLLIYESRLEMTDSSSFNNDGTNPTANFATPTNRNSNIVSHSGNRGRGNGQNQGRGNGRGQGRGRGRFNGNWKPRCQICRELGHFADNCHERTNLNFVPNTNHGNGNGRGGNNGNNFQRGYGFNQNSRGSNYGFHQNSGGNYGGNFNANMASMNESQDGYSDLNWYPDSGASNHITFDYNNFNAAGEFQGQEKLQVGNGAGTSYRQGNPSRES